MRKATSQADDVIQWSPPAALIGDFRCPPNEVPLPATNTQTLFLHMHRACAHPERTPNISYPSSHAFFSFFRAIEHTSSTLPVVFGNLFAKTTPLVHCNTMNGFARNQGVATCIRSFLSSCQKCSEFFELCATNCMTEGNRHPPLKRQCKNPLHFILENFPLEWIYSSILVRKARIFFFCNV